MQALVLNGLVSYRTDMPIPSLANDEALIRMRLAGICATDIELAKGYAGFKGILGHEFVGEVEAVGNESYNSWLAKRVVGAINIGCNICTVCTTTGPEHCANRQVLGIRAKNGAFADYLSLPICNLYAVPDSISDESAVFTEPLAAALRIKQQLQPLTVQTIAVLGPGRLGLLIAKVLALANYDVVVIGRTQMSLSLPKAWGLFTKLLENTTANSFDCIVDSTGQSAGFAKALELLRPHGTLMLKSSFFPENTLDISKIVVNELNIIGSRCGPFSDALAVLEEKALTVEDMLDGSYFLRDGLAALHLAGKAGVRKVLLHR